MEPTLSRCIVGECNQEWKISPERDFSQRDAFTDASSGFDTACTKCADEIWRWIFLHRQIRFEISALLKVRKVVLFEGQLLSVFSTPHSRPLGYWLARPRSVGSILHIAQSPVIENILLQSRLVIGKTAIPNLSGSTLIGQSVYSISVSSKYFTATKYLNIPIS